MKPDPTWNKWAEWLGGDDEPKLKSGTIYKDVVDMLAARQLWESFQEIVRVAPEEAREYGLFHSWFNGSYLRSQGLAVRRQVEVRDDVVSLGRLLDRIVKSPNVLLRQRHLALLQRDDHRSGNDFFDSVSGAGAKAIDPAVPLADLKRLKDETAQVRTWITKEVAHYDPRTEQFSQGLTFGDVHRCIELIFDTMNRYLRLICGRTSIGSVTMPPWQAVFRVAWIPDDAAWRKVAEAAVEKERQRIASPGLEQL